MASRISSKDSFDKGVLGGCREEVLLLVFMVLRLVGGDVGEDVKTDNWGGEMGALVMMYVGLLGILRKG